MSLKELLNDAIKRQQSLLDKAKKEERDLTDEEKRAFEEEQETIENLKRAIEASENQQIAPVQNPDAGESERKRCLEITELCREFEMDADTYIRNGNTAEEVREAVIKKLIQEKQPVSTGVTVGEDAGDKFRSAAVDGLMLRSGISLEHPAAGAGEFRNTSLRELAIECFRADGEDITRLFRMGNDEIYEKLLRDYYNPTASFPAILDNTINKSIVQLYQEVPTTFQLWTEKGSLTDFKESKDHEYVIGGAANFPTVPENGELKADKPKTEILPTRSLEQHGLTFSMSRKAFINDDIGFVAKIPGLYAQRAKKSIDKEVYLKLYKNGRFADGLTLFHEKHGNLLKNGTEPSQSEIQKMILAMQNQKDQFDEAIYMVPKYIIVPVGYGMVLDVILHSAYVTGSSNNDINPLAGKNLQVIETPVLNVLAGTNAAPWFMVADKSSARSIQVEYLNGQEMPTIRRVEKPGTLGYTWDIYLDWGISVRDYRGMVKNPGVAIESPLE